MQKQTTEKVEVSQKEWSMKRITTESLFLEQNENRDLN